MRVAAAADLHVTSAGTNGGYRDLFARVSDDADVVLLCGDLTNTGTAAEAEHLAEDIKACRIPVLAVLGNHDHESGHGEDVKKVLRSVNVTFLDEQCFTLRHVGFAGVKGFGGGFDKHMLSSFGEKAIKEFVGEALNEQLRLENQLRSLDTKHIVVALHYAPIAETIHGEAPEVYPFLGCGRLAETIDRFPVDAVFHGHAHHGSPLGHTAKGAPVYNCSVEVLKRKHAPHPYVVIVVESDSPGGKHGITEVGRVA